MSEAEHVDTAALPPSPGERLRDTRLAQGLDLGDIAARTRIPQRHLESIESGAYENLPSTTYAVGFARAYARAIGLDEAALAADVRTELGTGWNRPARTVPVYEVADPARTPSRAAVWGGVLVAAVLLIGVSLWYGTDLFRGRASPADAGEAVAVPIPETVTAAQAPTEGADRVAITATDEVWVHISDAAGQTLLMKTMTPGERFDLPADANDPRIEAGRPDKLAITVGGAAVAPLGDGRVAIRGVSLAAASLRARGSTAPAPAASPVATPSPTAAPRSTPRPTATPAPPIAPVPAATPVPRSAEPAPDDAAAPL